MPPQLKATNSIYRQNRFFTAETLIFIANFLARAPQQNKLFPAQANPNLLYRVVS